MTKNKKIIIGLGALVIIVGFVYAQFGNPSFNDDSALVTTNSNSINNSTSTSPEIIQSEAFFLQQINQLKQVSIENTQVIEGQEFKSLLDNTVTLKEFKAGRSNPYEPIDARVKLRERLEQEEARNAAAQAQTEVPAFNISDDLLRQSQNNSSGAGAQTTTPPQL